MEIVELTPDTWPSLEKLFGANKTVGGCWCCWFMRPPKEVDANWGEGNKKHLRDQVGRIPLGLLAVDDGDPVGWVAVSQDRRTQDWTIRRSPSRTLARTPGR